MAEYIVFVLVVLPFIVYLLLVLLDDIFHSLTFGSVRNSLISLTASQAQNIQKESIESIKLRRFFLYIIGIAFRDGHRNLEIYMRVHEYERPATKTTS